MSDDADDKPSKSLERSDNKYSANEETRRVRVETTTRKPNQTKRTRVQ